MRLTSDGNADRTRIFGILKIKTNWGCLKRMGVKLGATKRDKPHFARKIIGAVAGVTARKENIMEDKKKSSFRFG